MEQTTIFDAIAEREQAFARIERAEDYPTWAVGALAFVMQFAHTQRGQEFTGEDVVDAYSDRGLIEPKDARWWGPVIQKAKHVGVIVALAGRTAPRRKGHGTPGASVYVSGGGH
jgi:hypothetical protein